jgi:hypothetical protein
MKTEARFIHSIIYDSWGLYLTISVCAFGFFAPTKLLAMLTVIATLCAFLYIHIYLKNTPRMLIGSWLVGICMTATVFTIHSPLDIAFEKFRDQRIRILPVIDQEEWMNHVINMGDEEVFGIEHTDFIKYRNGSNFVKVRWARQSHVDLTVQLLHCIT